MTARERNRLHRQVGRENSIQGRTSAFSIRDLPKSVFSAVALTQVKTKVYVNNQFSQKAGVSRYLFHFINKN